MANTVLSGAVRLILVAIMTIEVSDPSTDVMTSFSGAKFPRISCPASRCAPPIPVRPNGLGKESDPNRLPSPFAMQMLKTMLPTVDT